MSAETIIATYGEQFLKSGEWWCVHCREEVPPGHFKSFPEHHINWFPSEEELRADPMTVACPTCGSTDMPCTQTRWGRQSFHMQRYSAAYRLTHPASPVPKEKESNDD